MHVDKQRWQSIIFTGKWGCKKCIDLLTIHTLVVKALARSNRQRFLRDGIQACEPSPIDTFNRVNFIQEFTEPDIVWVSLA